jgi:glycosyltransferase involved in cell wall biosynthesis
MRYANKDLFLSPLTIYHVALSYLCIMFQNNWSLPIFIIFCVIVAIQLFYYWYFFARLSFYKEKQQDNFNANPVSLVLCARDESPNLLKNLPAILAQEYPYTHELVIVDDNSYDDSAYVLEQFQKTYKHINIISLTEKAKFVQGKKFPLSVGIKASKYEILLLTDADCTPASPQWLSNMQGSFKNNIEIVLGYGAYKKRKGLLNKVIRFETFHTALQYLSYSLAGNPYMGVGRNLAYKKGLFNAHKGFTRHNNIPGGDDDLFVNEAATKYNTTININAETFTYSRPKNTWEEWRKQKKRHFSTSKYYKPQHKFLLSLYTIAQFFIYPSLTAALLFYNWMLVAGVFAIRLISLMIVWFGAMNKLQERDLKPWFLFFDIWLFFYFIRFAPSLLKKPRANWK